MAPVTTKNQAPKKFVVDTSAPVENGVFDQEAYVKFLTERIKVDNTLGNLGDKITITEEGNTVIIVSTVKFSGKYLKYLTKKYLKKNQLRDWIRFVATKTNQYRLQFYSIDEDEDDEEEDEE